jgi:hypothetical protein
VIPLSILDESDPATTPLQSLYREPILGVSLTTIDQVHAMVDRLEGLGPKEHVTVSVLVIVEPNILTKTIISQKSSNPFDVTELMVVDGSGLTGVSRIKLSLWSDPFGRAMLEKLLPFQSVAAPLHRFSTSPRPSVLSLSRFFLSFPFLSFFPFFPLDPLCLALHLSLPLSLL